MRFGDGDSRGGDLVRPRRFFFCARAFFCDRDRVARALSGFGTTNSTLWRFAFGAPSSRGWYLTRSKESSGYLRVRFDL
ncbi:MAG: hypothetical protein VYB51_07620 [Gemmatimonadota bacterium]|nr:hypothetical protein [Gemmatimonadota bacterium]